MVKIVSRLTIVIASAASRLARSGIAMPLFPAHRAT
jgi:hypothetical protein